MTTNPDLQAMQEQQLREIARERLQSAINYAINHLCCNIQPNLRIDLLADSQAELAKLKLSNA